MGAACDAAAALQKHDVVPSVVDVAQPLSNANFAEAALPVQGAA